MTLKAHTGIVDLQSHQAVDQTVARLTAVLQEKESNCSR